MQVKKESALNDIVNAAKEEFLTRGYKSASMRIIAGRAGMSAGNVYKYFKSKEDLFLYITEPQWEKLRAMYRRMDADADKSLSAAETVSELSGAVYKWAAALDALYNPDTYIILAAKDGPGCESAEKELSERIVKGILALCGRGGNIKLPERYPLEHFVQRLVFEMEVTAVKYRDSGRLRAILRNQFITSAMGFVISLF